MVFSFEVVQASPDLHISLKSFGGGGETNILCYSFCAAKSVCPCCNKNTDIRYFIREISPLLVMFSQTLNILTFVKACWLGRKGYTFLFQAYCRGRSISQDVIQGSLSTLEFLIHNNLNKPPKDPRVAHNTIGKLQTYGRKAQRQFRNNMASTASTHI